MSSQEKFKVQRRTFEYRLKHIFQTPQILCVAVEYGVMKLEGMSPDEYAEYLPLNVTYEKLLEFSFGESSSPLRRFVQPEVNNLRKQLHQRLEYFSSGSAYSFSFEADDLEVGFQRRNK